MSDEPKARSSKAFDLSKSILTVVLASVAAAWISHHYKVEEENSAVYAESRKAATNTYYDIIDTIGKRHYYALRAAIGFQWHDDEMAHWLRKHARVLERTSLQYIGFNQTVLWSRNGTTVQRFHSEV